MSLFHAVVWMDHNEAHVLQFDAEHVEAQKVKARTHHRRGTDRPTDASGFFSDISQTLNGVHEVLLCGPAQTKQQLAEWAPSHAPALARAIVGTETVDHPTDAQLVAFARKYFLKHDRMSGTPVPSV